MTYIHTSRLYFGLLFLILLFEQCCSAAALKERSSNDVSGDFHGFSFGDVNCMIINVEYVECFWRPNTSTMNYTFSSAFANDVFHDCPEYILEHNYTVGCKIPLKNQNQRFKKFETIVFIEGNRNITKHFESLQGKVQLNPPYNLSVVWNEHNSTLLLQWKSSAPLLKHCVVYNVRKQKDESQTLNVTETSFSLSQVSQSKHYVFQVRSTVADSCGPSGLWSNWSAPVEWASAGWWQWLYGVLPIILLFLLCFCLCYYERKRFVILLSVVPDPSKNLQDLFHKHDGNVESWVHISREMKEAFEPDYTEPSCDVCEVTPPCDAGPTPVTSPSSLTDKCDELCCSSEEPAEQPS